MTTASNRQVIDLNIWHHAIHQVTGDMARRFNTATPPDLQRWADMLRTVANDMTGICTKIAPQPADH